MLVLKDSYFSSTLECYLFLPPFHVLLSVLNALLDVGEELILPRISVRVLQCWFLIRTSPQRGPFMIRGLDGLPWESCTAWKVPWWPHLRERVAYFYSPK